MATGLSGTLSMTQAEWIAYIILPAAIALFGYIGSRIFEIRLRRSREMRNRTARDLKAAE
jgi:hypothetical protein